MKRRLFNIIRHLCQKGFLGFYYPPEFSIRTCLRWRMYQHEDATLKYLKAFLKPGDVFVDIGAYIGYFAVYTAKLVRKKGVVYAFEPNSDNYRLLIKNCRNIPWVKTIQSAVSDSNGEAELFIHSTSSSSHALSDISKSGKSYIVPKVSLDKWASKNNINRINMVLIDVEGHELAVLRGMYNVIDKNPDIHIIIEYCPHNWTDSNQDIKLLINEIYNKMHFKVIYALGQKKEYAFSDLTSAQIAYQKLNEILQQEVIQEKHDYINIVITKC